MLMHRKYAVAMNSTKPLSLQTCVRFPDIKSRKIWNDFVFYARIRGIKVGKLLTDVIEEFLRRQEEEPLEKRLLDTLEDICERQARLEKRLDELAWQIQNLQVVAVAPTAKPQLEKSPTPARVDVRRFASVRSEADNPWLQVLAEKKQK